MAKMAESLRADDIGNYGFYAELRETSPTYWSDELQLWVLTRYDDVRHAYRNPGIFSSETFGQRGGKNDLGSPSQQRVVNTFSRQILLLDRPEHTRLRRLVSYVFTPRAVAGMRDYIDRTARGMLDALHARDSFDFVADFAGPLPLQIVTEMLDVAVADRAGYRAWSDSLTTVTEANQPEWVLRAAFAHADEMRAYLADLVDRRRGRLGEDLLSRLIEARVDGDSLDTDEIVAMAMIITTAGHETTTSLLTNSLRLLAADPAVRGSLAEDETFRRRAIEETLRWEPPLQFGTRVLTEDAVLNGVIVPQGAGIALCIAAANRDPRVFASPETFDPNRADNPHLTFGHGIHSCLGAGLARLEADIVLAAIAKDYPTLRVGDPVKRKASPLLRGFGGAEARWN
jgi:cytochrome P450